MTLGILLAIDPKYLLFTSDIVCNFSRELFLGRVHIVRRQAELLNDREHAA
jgi:hypothetical protein